jgi:hypothetical protein
VCFSESFESLSTGLQNALWTLGGVPESHRTDHLGAAMLGAQEREDFGTHYMALMRHYDICPTKNNAGKSNENGDVEQAHYRIKERVAQALLLRGSRDFASRTEYDCFLRRIFAEKNRNRTNRFEPELAQLKPLPAYRLHDHRKYQVPVGIWSTVQVSNNTYSVPSLLIRHEVIARVHADRIDIRFAGQCVCSIARLRGKGKARINYRHVIGSLVRKPGAFENYRYREEMFPSTAFRQAYDYLLQQDWFHASRRYLAILEWAALNSEASMGASLCQLINAGEDLCFERLVGLPERPMEKPLEIDIPIPDLVAYDSLLQEVTL